MITEVTRWVSDIACGTNPETGEAMNTTLEERLYALDKGYRTATEKDEQAAYANGIQIVRKMIDNRDARLTKTRR